MKAESKKTKIFFRADGNKNIGLGHVIRSLALADMLREKFNCYFVTQIPLESVKKQILEVCQQIIVLPKTEDTSTEAEMIAEKFLNEGDIIVLDGYRFDTTYQTILKNKGCKIACIDDIHTHHFVADIVINHAPSVEEVRYSKENYTSLYTGTDYALLRTPFLSAAKKFRDIKQIRSVFICFGGADSLNLTQQLMKILSQIKNASIEKMHVVLGGANIFRKEIEKFVQETNNINIEIFQDLSAYEMVNLMSESQLAIVPASSILFEVLAVKMPVVSGYYVDNQENIFNGFSKTGCIYPLGDFRELNQEKIEDALESFNENVYLIELLERQSKLIDGEMPKRYYELFKTLARA